MENKVMVTSASDMTIILNIPDMTLRKTWAKRGQSYPFDREILEQAYYDPSLEYLFKEGMLTTTDKQFLIDVGLMDEETEQTSVYVLTDTAMSRMIKVMPIKDLTEELKKLSHTQLNELGDYAIQHNEDLKMDRLDILSKATGKNLLKAIENFKASKEN